MKADVEISLVNDVGNFSGESDNSFQILIEYFLKLLFCLNVMDAI